MSQKHDFMLWFNESLSHQSICNDCRVLDIELSHPWGQIELKAGTFLENHCQIRVVTWGGTIFSLSVPYWGCVGNLSRMRGR